MYKSLEDLMAGIIAFLLNRLLVLDGVLCSDR